MLSADRPATRLATRLAFLVAGFGVAAWAPLVPYAKARVGADDATLGLLLLCLGGGSVAAMLLTGVLSARYGARPIIILSGFGMVLFLPLLMVADTAALLALVLVAFGAALGSLDVAMNIHAVEVERASGRPMMSGFHALFSLGGFGGSTLVTFLLSAGLGTLPATLVCAVLMAVAMVLASPRLMRTTRSEGAPLFAVPKGVVLVLTLLAGITFLAEGAILDWSALLVTGMGLVPVAQGGLGYMLFAIAMTAGRLGGDRVATRVGDRATLFWGGVLAIVGFAVLLTAPVAVVAMAGFVLIGLGASNVVPVLFRLAGKQTVMPFGLAVAALTTVGYAGILVGPAAIGFVANAVGLPGAMWMLAGLLLLVPLFARSVTAAGK